MKILLHDLDTSVFSILGIKTNDDVIIIKDNGHIRNCIGCFGCWVKTPGMCVLKDGYENMGELLSKCDELVIISRCIYGSYSPFIRNIFDRSIPYLLPYFCKKNKETHHKNRYNNNIRISTFFYGDNITSQEKKTAKALVKANAVNFYSDKINVGFYKYVEDIKEVHL